MKPASTIISILMVLLLVAGCTPEAPTSLTEYNQWFAHPDNGCTKVREVGPLAYEVQFRPVDLLVANEFSSNKVVTQALIDSLRSTYGGGQYFLLKVRPTDQIDEVSGDLVKNYSNNYVEYTTAIEALAFDMPQFVSLVAGTDTLQPAIHHYEQGFELQSEQRFLFGFVTDKALNTQEMTFIFDDTLFGAGRLKFKFTPDTSRFPKFPISS